MKADANARVCDPDFPVDRLATAMKRGATQGPTLEATPATNTSGAAYGLREPTAARLCEIGSNIYFPGADAVVMPLVLSYLIVVSVELAANDLSVVASCVPGHHRSYVETPLAVVEE